MIKHEIIYYTDLNTEVKNSQNNQESSTLHNPFPANIGISGHSYRGAEKTIDGVVVDSLTPTGLNIVKDITIIEDSTSRLENARQYQKLNPNKKILHEKRVEITEAAYKKLSDNAALLEPYLTTSKYHPKPVPHELVGGEFSLKNHNCNHWINSEHRLADLEGTFTYYYSTQEFADTPGLIHTDVGFFRDKKQFVPGDKERTVVTDLSLEDFATEQNLPLSRIKKKELVKLPEPDGLMFQPEEKNAYVIAPNPALVASAALEGTQLDENFAQLAVTEEERESKVKSIIEAIQGIPDYDTAIAQEAANHKTFVIAPNPDLVAAAASEEVLTPIQHDDESMEKLAVALEQGLYLFEDGTLKKSYGKGLPGKPIAIDYNTEQGKYKDLMRDGHPLRRSVVYLPIHEAIASGTEGRYTAQDLLELQRSNFQAITATSQGSMLASDVDKKPAFDENSTPSTASNSEQEQQRSVQQNTAPVDPEYEDYLIRSKAMMASFPFLLQQIEERSGLYSYESWKKAHDIGMEIAKTSKVKSIIEASLKAFKEKFEAIRDKFTKKLKDDIEKSAKDAANDSQENGQAEYDAQAQAIHQQKAQEINAMRDQLQSSYNSQVAAIAQSKKGECDTFFQQSKSECEAVFAARSAAASNQPSSSGLAFSICVSNSDIVAQKNAEVSAFNAKKSAEMAAEQQALHAQTQSQLVSYIASKEAEADQKCNALKSSIEQRLKSTQESKIKEIAEAATNKEKTQVAECNRKIKDIQEDTGLIERLKEVVGNSGDASAEALINEELNVVLQGAASDFGVDAVNL